MDAILSKHAKEGQGPVAQGEDTLDKDAMTKHAEEIASKALESTTTMADDAGNPLKPEAPHTLNLRF